jgi:NDP-sugar pyrophosphorylase family protein
MEQQVTTAIILCAGRGTRMGHLTDTLPKPLLPLSNGVTLLEAKLRVLPQSIKRIILIVGYLEEKIREHIGTSYEGKEVLYVTQDIEKVYGTGAALYLCKSYIDNNPSLIMMGDDIYAQEDLEALCQHKNAILVAYLGEAKFGAKWQVEVSHENTLIRFYPGIPSKEEATGIINTGAYVFSKEYFQTEPVMGVSGEIEIPPTMVAMIEAGTVFNVVKATTWKQVTAPEDLVLEN